MVISSLNYGGAGALIMCKIDSWEKCSDRAAAGEEPVMDSGEKMQCRKGGVGEKKKKPLPLSLHPPSSLYRSFSAFLLKIHRISTNYVSIIYECTLVVCLPSRPSPFLRLEGASGRRERR